MAYWQQVKYKSKKISKSFGDGINTYLSPFEIKDSEAIYSVNMCSDKYPAIQTRNDINYMRNLYGISVLYPITGTVYACGKRPFATSTEYSDELHILENNTWKYARMGNYGTTDWVAISTEMLDNKGTFINFNTEANRYTILLNPSIDRDPFYAYNGTTDLTSLTTNAPNTYLYTVHRYRVFGVEDDYKTIKYSAIGTCTDWTSDPGLNSGSFVLTQASGDITAITTYQDHVIIWTKTSMHELYGYEPLNFVVQDISMDIGCTNQFAFAELNGVLYFVNGHDIYMYSGGIPQLISQKLEKLLINFFYNNYIDVTAVIPHKNKLYFILKSNNNEATIVYNTDKNTWDILDVNDMVNNIGTLTWACGIGNFYSPLNSEEYYPVVIPNLSTVAKYNYVQTLDFGTQTGYDFLLSTAPDKINASFYTKAYSDITLDSFTSVRDVSLKYSCKSVEGISYLPLSSATIYVDYSTEVESINGTWKNLIPTTEIPVSTDVKVITHYVTTTTLQNTQHYSLKFEASGNVTIHGLQLNCISYGGDL